MSLLDSDMSTANLGHVKCLDLSREKITLPTRKSGTLVGDGTVYRPISLSTVWNTLLLVLLLFLRQFSSSIFN